MSLTRYESKGPLQLMSRLVFYCNFTSRANSAVFRSFPQLYFWILLSNNPGRPGQRTARAHRWNNACADVFIKFVGDFVKPLRRTNPRSAVR